MFLPNTASAGALQLAESLRRTVEELNPSIGERNLHITASIGVAASGDAPEEMHAIQQRADQAMYVAKKLGRNRVSAIDPGIQSKSISDAAMQDWR